MAYPAQFDVTPPLEFDKAQVALRVLIVIVLLVFQIFNLVVGGAYLLLPVAAAVLVSQKGAEQYLTGAEQGPMKWLRYLMGFYSYMALATDKLPTSDPEEVVDLRVQKEGEPSVGQALLRIVLAIPHAIVLFVLGIIFVVCWIVAAISILVNGVYPVWAASYIRHYLRWVARLMVYMASLVEEYPPFSFEDDVPARESQAGVTGSGDKSAAPD